MEPTLWLPEGASTLSPEIDALFNFVNYTSLVLFLLVVGGMLYFVWKYRRRSPADRPAPFKESVVLEATWIVVPTILVLLVFTWGFQSFIKLQVAPPDAYEISAEGYQWGWNFTYPEGFSTAGEMYVPVGRPVRMIMNSTDVLHSFYIPAFRVKQDVIPGRYSSVWFEATKEGVYDIFCTEYCGTQHSGMIAKIHVVDQNEYSEWVDSGGAGDLQELPLPEQGRILAQKNACTQCHSIDGSRMSGPTWAGLYGQQAHATSAGAVVVDENYLRESILMPAAKIVEGYGNNMPSTYASLPDWQLTALIAYIKTLE